MNSKSRSIISFVAVILGFFMALLDTTIVNITLPKMTEYFNTSLDHISWVVNGYNLAFAVLIITASRLADQFGRKKLFIMGVSLFAFSSFLSGMSQSVNMLIFFRVLQGLSAAFVVPVTVPLSVNIFPPEKRGMIMGLWGAFAGLAAASGPSLGGILTQYFSWRAVFFINIPIAAASVILTSKYIKESYDPTADKSLDLGGITTISIAMFTLIYGLIKVNDNGWTSTITLSLFAIAFVAFVAFILIELKIKSPMLPMGLFKIIPFTSGAIALFLLGVGMMSASFFLSFFLVQIKGLSQLSAGLVISTMSLSSMVLSGFIGGLIEKHSGRWFGALGMLLLALACYLYSSLTQNSTNLDVILRLIVGGAGMGMSMSSMMSSMVKNVPQNKVGITSGVNNMARTLGTVLGVAVFVTIFNSNMTKQMTEAKRETASIIKVDKVFNDAAKTSIIASLNSENKNRKSVSVQDVLKTIDAKEAEVIKTVPESAKQNVKESFETQKRETLKLWTPIQDSFLSHMVKAFSTTFKLGTVILIPGILFALFSDKKKKRTLVRQS